MISLRLASLESRTMRIFCPCSVVLITVLKELIELYILLWLYPGALEKAWQIWCLKEYFGFLDSGQVFIKLGNIWPSNLKWKKAWTNSKSPRLFWTPSSAKVTGQQLASNINGHQSQQGEDWQTRAVLTGENMQEDTIWNSSVRETGMLGVRKWTFWGPKIEESLHTIAIFSYEAYRTLTEKLRRVLRKSLFGYRNGGEGEFTLQEGHNAPVGLFSHLSYRIKARICKKRVISTLVFGHWRKSTTAEEGMGKTPPPWRRVGKHASWGK